jgi:hypothetical protein
VTNARLKRVASSNDFKGLALAEPEGVAAIPRQVLPDVFTDRHEVGAKAMLANSLAIRLTKTL